MLDTTTPKFSHVKAGRHPGAATGCATSSCTATSASTEATAGRVIAQLVKANMAPEKGTGWHRHEAEFHIVLMTKGWARFMYEDKETLVAAGDCVHQRPGIVHYLFDYSPDMEYLEVVGRPTSRSIDVPAPCEVPAPSRGAGRKVRLRRRPPQNSMSSSSISSGSRFAAAIHSCISGIAMIVLHIEQAGPVELHVVGAEARDDRGVHRIGHAALRAEQARPAVALEALAPDRRDALDVRERAGPHLVAREIALQVHRQGRAQAGEAGMHLAADGPAVGARRAVRGQQAAVGHHLGEVLADRERVPHLDALVRQARHPDATGTAAGSPGARRRRPDRPSPPRTSSPAKRAISQPRNDQDE